MELLVPYLFLINAAGLLLMRADKQKARNHQWRIPEKVLLCTAFAGGSLGVLLGIRLFRHKTRHLLFSLGVPCVLCAQILLLFFLL